MCLSKVYLRVIKKKIIFSFLMHFEIKFKKFFSYMECKWANISELEIFLRNEKIDICLISETHFTKQSYVTIR